MTNHVLMKNVKYYSEENLEHFGALNPYFVISFKHFIVTSFQEKNFMQEGRMFSGQIDENSTHRIHILSI